MFNFFLSEDSCISYDSFNGFDYRGVDYIKIVDLLDMRNYELELDSV